MCSPMSLEDLLNVIFSPELAFGVTPSGAPVGLTTVPSGQDLARANLSARLAKVAGLLTSGTYGLPSSTSSSSADLSQSLANRLRQKTDSLGSTLYKLTWKERVTPSGRLIPALRGSVRRTSDKGCIGWLTPRASDWKGFKNNGSGGLNLMSQSQLAAWPTPSSRDWKDSPGMAVEATNPDGSTRIRLDQLPRVTNLTTPARLTAGGQMLTGSSARMENGGQLNPAHSRWLMGLPTEWDDCAVMVTLSSLRKQRNL